MKVIIAGSRKGATFDDIRKGVHLFRSNYGPIEFTEIVSGMAPGVDSLAVVYANSNRIKLKPMPAEWEEYGKAAGPMRNAKMADYADALIAIWDGKSPGTKNMIEAMRRRGKKTVVFMFRR